jgi:hypothetical protein
MTIDTAIHTDTRDSLLRLAIRLDATGVGLIGLAMAAFADPLAGFTGLTPAQMYIGAVAFVLYGAVGNWLAGRPDVRAIGTGLSIFNFVGAAAQMAVVPAQVLPLTGAGEALAVAFGLWALLFGVLQLAGVRRLA